MMQSNKKVKALESPDVQDIHLWMVRRLWGDRIVSHTFGEIKRH